MCNRSRNHKRFVVFQRIIITFIIIGLGCSMFVIARPSYCVNCSINSFVKQYNSFTSLRSFRSMNQTYDLLSHIYGPYPCSVQQKVPGSGQLVPVLLNLVMARLLPLPNSMIAKHPVFISGVLRIEFQTLKIGFQSNLGDL